jgi:hypothetical protein
MPHDPEDAVLELQKHAEIYRACHISTYECCRTAANGETQYVTVEIRESRSRDGVPRFDVEARSDDGKIAKGSGAPTLPEALATLHWSDLDK